MHRSSLALAAALALLAPSAATAKKAPGKPPSMAVIKKEMTDQYLGSDPVDYPSARYSLVIDRVRRGTPRKGSYRHDGVPPGKTTYVFPTEVFMTYTVCYQDGTARRDKIDGKYGFWRDDFGDWTHREYGEHRTSPTADHLGSCPL